MRFGVSDAEDLRPCLIATGLKRKDRATPEISACAYVVLK